MVNLLDNGGLELQNNLAKGYLLGSVRKEPKGFGANLRSRREAAGLQSNELAARLRVKPPVISKWELTSIMPESPTLLRLAKALNCSVDELLIGVDAEYDKLLANRDLTRQTGDQKSALPPRTGGAHDSTAATRVFELEQENGKLRTALEKVSDVASQLIQIAKVGIEGDRAAEARPGGRRRDRKTG